MSKKNYEFRALIIGVIINLISAIVGFIFFYLTTSMSILLDGLISAILCGSTMVSIFVSNYVNKNDSKKYPFGRYAIENIFLLFRAIMMLGTIIFTILDGALTILDFINNKTIDNFNASNWQLIVYGLSMCGLCLLITVVYSILNKKSQVKSEIIRIEIKASLYDGLVTLIAISSLLLFSNIEFLSSIKEIGDSITVIILSIIYLYSPLKELIGQIKILVDRRRFIETEKELTNGLQNKFSTFKFNDLYFAFSGDHYQIYISLYPKQNLKTEEISKKFQDIKIYLLLSREMIHNM
jgi:divalent metal cation (Fe/Co/Zn/Cd) transporter